MKDSGSLDLHGYTVPEAISRFSSFYNGLVRGGRRGFVEVIHGYGSTGQGGAIKTALHKVLNANSECFESWISGDSLGNPGMTKIYPKKLLPSASLEADTPIRQAILRFCDTPRARTKIVSKLVGRFGDRAVQDEMNAMVRAGILQDSNGKLSRV